MKSREIRHLITVIGIILPEVKFLTIDSEGYKVLNNEYLKFIDLEVK